uniref:head GIN domain-containing protein n=2 Tax=Flavobacterium sp. TaxID=239 RepID=UPI00404B32B1
MRKLIFILGLLFCIGCSSVEDCLQNAGSETETIAELPFFNKINVQPGVGLVLKQSNEQLVTIKTGSHILETVTFEVMDETLFLKQNNDCFWNQPYGKTTVEVSIPNLIQLQSTTEQDVFSDGILSFEDFTIIAFEEGKAASSGNFYLKLNTQNFRIESNTIASFFLEGTTDYLEINYYAGDGRCEAANLIAQEVSVFHRSTNDIIVNPQQKITGIIYSTGNVVLKNKPPIIDVNALYKGQFIFN